MVAKFDSSPEAEKETARIEAFSDGVIAIAITLLVLDVKVPTAQELGGASLMRALLRQWPIYFAFVTSFLTILIMWVNHHRMFRVIKYSDHWFLIINGLLLMSITLVPFPTALLAEYIGHAYAPTAAAVYSGSFILIAILFNVMWRYASRGGRLLGAQHDRELAATITKQYRFGPLLYVAAFALAFFSVAASVGLCMALAVFFALPGTTKRARVTAQH
ncbi:MAG: DUF1211 domain-containing protein [Acidobacteria bacterium]|nr:MAG: DUF1211 domain-containing protein [Acidobacteriota bacterium]